MYTDCFARKKTIDFFSKQMEKGRKHPTRSQKVGHVGVYFAKMSGKIEDGFTDILGFKLRYLVFGRRGVFFDLYTRVAYKFCSQKKK